MSQIRRTLRNATRARQRGTERGFTLIELLFYMSFVVVVLSIAGGILINSLRVERTVRASTDAASLGQLIAQSIARGARNATAIQVSDPSETTTGVVGTQLLVMDAFTDGSTATSECNAWLYVPLHGGQLFTAQSPTRIPVPSVGYLADTPSDDPISAPAGWSSFGEGTNPPASAATFELLNHQLTIKFDVTVPGEAAESVSTVESSRQALAGSSPCF